MMTTPTHTDTREIAAYLPHADAPGHPMHDDYAVARDRSIRTGGLWSDGDVSHVLHLDRMADDLLARDALGSALITTADSAVLADENPDAWRTVAPQGRAHSSLSEYRDAIRSYPRRHGLRFRESYTRAFSQVVHADRSNAPACNVAWHASELADAVTSVSLRPRDVADRYDFRPAPKGKVQLRWPTRERLAQVHPRKGERGVRIPAVSVPSVIVRNESDRRVRRNQIGPVAVPGATYGPTLPGAGVQALPAAYVDTNRVWVGHTLVTRSAATGKPRTSRAASLGLADDMARIREAAARVLATRAPESVEVLGHRVDMRPCSKRGLPISASVTKPHLAWSIGEHSGISVTGLAVGKAVARVLDGAAA